MDYLAHGLWGYAIYSRSPRPWLGAFWNVFPDTISWVPFFFYRTFTSGFGRPELGAGLPEWMDFLYGLSHSVVVFAAALCISYVIYRRIPIYIWGWLIHIAIDVPTHAATIWPTPFLWPIADVKFPGISWGTQWFMIANYAALAIVYISIYYRRRKHVHGHS